MPHERQQFKALVLANPNYFGNLELSPYKPIKLLQGDTGFEDISCTGLNPPYDRLEAIVRIKRSNGYGGDICSPGSFEFVRFYVDLHDNGIWHDVGLASVRVHDIPGDKPLCYAVYRDFQSVRKLCSFENIVRVRAILSWNVPPPANTPNFNPVWGNVLTVQVQIQPRRKIWWQDILVPIELAKVEFPDPIGPVIKGLAPQTPIAALPTTALTLPQKKALYAGKGVPVHRFGFPEAQALLASPAASAAIFVANAKGPLVDLGLEFSEVADLIGKIQFVTDGDTSFEELRCVGLRPSQDMLEAVVTVKKSSGYSGSLCANGSYEYVAFWMDFGDGAGFTYMGTSTVQVHDLQTLPNEDVQYAVFLKKDLSKWLVPCQSGPKLARLRAILSWEQAPPPGNPNYVPVWGNREECLVQLRPGELVGRIPIMETIGDVGIDDINQGDGLATGSGVIGNFSVNQSPFGGEVTITGRIGDPPNSFNGGPVPLKYRIRVHKDDGIDPGHAITDTVAIKLTKFIAGVPQEESPGDTLFDVNLVSGDDGDGLGAGWYQYLEDPTGPDTRFVVGDVLAKWQTTVAMEGEWLISIDAKDPSVNPPIFYAGTQSVRVRIDNTPPSAMLAITGATFNGNPLVPVDCGKFPVGTIIEGTYESHDPGTSSPNQHFGSLCLDVIPDGPANGAVAHPDLPYVLSGTSACRSFPVVSTSGEAGTWTLDTAGMEPCGYVVRLSACDRTNYDSRGNALCTQHDIGFCLEEAPQG